MTEGNAEDAKMLINSEGEIFSYLLLYFNELPVIG